MTLRSENERQQGVRWLAGFAVAMVVYVVVFAVLYGGAFWNVIGAMQLRVLLPTLAVFALFAYETRRREGREATGEVEVKDPNPEVDARTFDVSRSAPEVKEAAPQPEVEPPVLETAAPKPETAAPKPPEAVVESVPVPGEAEYQRARGISHQLIPDLILDREYMTLLAKSAKLGYPMAMSKLGDYAMRRGALVEAYYWYKRAKAGGMLGLERMLVQVRAAWRMEGSPRQFENEYEFFPQASGEEGYQMLCDDSRR